MTILNLNGPAGREPRSTKTVRAWMGVGLVIAVLGIGSTFAANININGNVDSEFGQGVTKTVYCGETKTDIIVAPVSKFVNEYTIAGRAAVPSRWTAPTYTGRTFVRVSSSSSTAVGEGTYVNDLSGATETKVKGYWISSRTSSNPTYSSNGNSSGSNTVFVPQVRDNNDYGFYKYSSWTLGSMSIAIQAIAPKVVDSSFVLTGITVSNIDSQCLGRNFVLSAYGDSATAADLVTGYKEVAVLYEAGETDTFSFSRSLSGVPSNKDALAEVVGSTKQFTITFKDGSGRLSTGLFENIVVETQEDLLSSTPVGEEDEGDDD